MKNFLRVAALAICAILMTANASAQVITAERASEIANQFFANGKQKSSALRSSNVTLTKSSDSRAITGNSNDAPTFHILTGANGKGFVIVSGEETEKPILGYSFDGTIDTNNLPDGIVDYMTDIDAQIRALRQYNAANPQKAAARSAMQKATATETGGTIVVELNTAQWAQGSPYNNYCFLEGATGTTKASTGCVPTAYSILCYYHKWPESAKEVTVYHANTGASMTLGHTYDYESMSNVSTEAGANAVATLMRDLGWAYQVSYGVGNTGTGNKGEGPGTLMDVFNYKSETPCNHGNYTSNRSTLGDDELWMQYIKESLDAGLPIPYSSTTSAAGTARHIYILDGYTNNNYFHFNWGWGGNGNGWFTLNNMVVDTSSDYSNSHKAYFKLMPNKTPRTVTATTNSSSMGTVSINGGTAGNSVSAEVTEGTKATLTAHPADGYALASWTKNGVIVGTKNPIQVTVGESGNDYVANFDDAANVLINKDYVINPANGSLSDGTSKYSTWTSTDTQPALTLKATNADGAAVYAISALTSSYKCYATAYDSSEKAHTSITYTLSVPEGYVIKSYTMTYVVGTANQITLNGSLLSSTGTFDLSAAPNSQTASFTMSVSSAGQQYLTIKSINVNVQSEGGASTPTPEPEPEPTPATYTITTTASPAEGGAAKFAVGTGSQKTQGDVENGTQITLYATANTGYTFVNWTLNGTAVGTTETCNVTVSQAANYVANFEAVQQGGSSNDDLAGKYFRLKVKNTTNYMNIANTSENTGSTSGVTVVAKNESSDTQIFLFEQSGDGYKLKANSGNYIKCHAWNANANTTSANDATVLTFETTGNELEYLIKWDNTNMNNGVERDDYFKAENGYVYCDAASNAASTWVLEEVIEKTLTVTFSGATWGNAESGWYDYVTTTNTPAVTVKTTTSEGAKAIGFSTVSGVKHPYLLDGNSFTISLPANCKIVGYELTYFGHNLNTKTFTYTGNNGNTATETVGQNSVDKTLTVTGLNNSEIAISVSDQTSQAGVIIKALEITYIEDTDLETYTVAVTAGENGTATASAETVVEGDNVTLTATANTDYKFVGWYNGETKVSEANPYTFAVTSNISYEARFEELFPDGAYKIYWQQNNRGYLAYHETNSPSKAVLADVTYTGCANLHYNSSSDPVNLNWYLITADDGKRYLFQATTGKFLGYESGTTNNKLNLTEALPIAIEENIKHSGYYIITSTINNNSRVLLCSACGTETKNNGNGVRWLDVTDSNQQDGGAPLKFVPVSDVTVAESVMNTVLRVINGNNAVPFKVEIEGLRENDPNTHFATITVGGTAVKLAPAHLTQSEIEATLVAGSTLAINHKYRGFEFNGFYIGTTSLGESATLTDEQIAAISATTPLVAKFTATNTGEATLFSAEDEFSYRIPAIAKTGTNRLVAISDYRHSHDDIGRDNHGTGTLQVDLVMRTSDDNGATWSAKQTIAEGTSTFGYGDAAVAVNGENILVMAVAGNVFFTNANATNKQKTYRIYSTNNGQSWEKQEVSNNLYDLFPNANGMFFGSGKLVVDPDFNGTGNARVYGAMLLNDGNNYVLYSDNWGKTWNILGGKAAASANEPKVEILPNGQILLSSRRSGGRTFNVFTYTDKANNAGNWDSAANGCNNDGNATNGEIICLDAKCTNGKPTKILLQSQPSASDRRNVSIWYKELSGDNFTALDIASGWTKGLQVSDQLSAYSAMCLQENGKIALFFEEAPCHNDDATYGYSMVYVPLTIEEITENNFLNPNADVEYVPIEFNIELTDTEGNIYRETLDYIPTDVAAALTAKYPFITLGENGVVTDNKYTNTVTLPFKVSNAETTAWYNIYWPANTTENDYPVYLSATSATDTYVPKVTESKAYGESSYNTLDNGDKIAWSIYSVNNSFEFIFKNKLTGKYIQATGVATGNAQNVKYAEETEATAFTLLKKTGNYAGEYALVAKVSETTGYLCSTSATGYSYATHYNGNGHEGAWLKFVAAPDYQAIVDALTANVAKFGAGDGNYTDNNDIDAIKAIIENIANTPLNTLNTHTETVQTVKDSYREVVLTVNDDETATVPGTISITVNGSEAETVNNKFVPANATVSILAIANPGYRFVNWRRPAAQASAAARTAEARNSDVVSDQNPYTVTVSEALSLEANFEQIVVNVTLTDAQSNTYEVQVSDFTTEITKDAVADKLREAYPYITLGTTDQEGNVIDFGVLNIDGTAYTYTNRVELPFKVTNTTYLWHNIYYPSNGGNPNYIAALNEDEVVDMAASKDYAYGDNPTYNTKDGGNSICWAIYNVNNSFEFIFKSRVTGKYIKVESVSSETTENVQFVENAGDATAFTLLKDAGSYNGDYALAAKVGEAEGYLCAASSSKSYLTHFYRTNHQGAWVKFAEAPDYFSKIMDLGIMLGYKFGAGDGKCVIAGTNIEEVDNAMQNSGSITLNKLNDYAARMEAAWATENPTWFDVKTSAENGTAYITLENDDPELTSKRVPGGYELTVKATPATGYHFTGWTMNGTAIEGATEEHTFTVTEATTIVASFAINTYTVNVTAGENGSVTVTHDVNGETVDINGKTVDFATVIKIEATPNDGYKFIGWYNGEELQHSINPHEFAINHDINYTARFEKNEAGSTTNTYVIKIDAILTDGETAANNGTGNVQAIIHGIGQDWATSAEVVENATVELVAISDHNQSAYLFEGWYKNGELVSTALSYKVAVTETVTYEARFVKGKVIKLTSNNKSLCLPKMPTYTDGSEVAGTITALRAVVRDGEEILISIDDSVIANFTGEGYRVANWTDKDGNEVAGKNVYSFTITVNGDNTYKVNLEKDTYTLTVSTEGTMGTVHIGDGTETSVTVNNGGTAKITATPNSGYKFVNWTLNGVVVSTENPYNVPAITDNVQYVAVFAEAAALNAGYYRIAYDFPETATNAPAARTGVTRAAREQYEISPSTGDIASGSKACVWNYTANNNPAGLKIVAIDASGQKVNAISATSGDSSKLKFSVFGVLEGTETYSSESTTFTVSVNENYLITGYSLVYTVSSASRITVSDEFGYSATPSSRTEPQTMSKDNISAQSIRFNLSAASFVNSYAAQVNSFVVYVQKVSGETPEPEPEPDTETVRYYMQSVAGTNNALQMTTDGEGISSIFYYGDNKLLSYQKGTYIKEDGGTRGLQEVGVYGDVEIKIVDTNENEENICTIKAPSYLHAMNGSTYYVDHCGSNEGTNAHANHNFAIEEVDKLPVTIGTALHATFYAPVAVEIPEGVKAYVLKEKYITAGSYVTMTRLSSIIPANTGVILKSDEAKEYDFYIVAPSNDAKEEADDNVFKGTVAKTKITEDAYILANRNGKIGLYPVAKNAYLDTSTTTTTVRFTNNSHKAYLPVEGNFAELLKRGTGFRFIFDDEGTTGIEDIEGSETEDTIYDLQGRKLSEITQSGIYIVNGKKIFVK